MPDLERIEKELVALTEFCPDFANCQNSTLYVLEGMLEGNEDIEYHTSIISRVYDKDDDKKRPVAYMYIDFLGVGKKFFVADKSSNQFVTLNQQEFENKYECYESDRSKVSGIRPWENSCSTAKREEDAVCI